MSTTTEDLTKQILNTVRVAGKPVSAAEIRRALPGLVEASEISCRLRKLVNSGRIVASRAPATAITGPRIIRMYSVPGVVQFPLSAAPARDSADWNIFQLLPQTQ